MSREDFKFPMKKIVKVKPNDRNPGWIKNPKHAGYFKLEGCYDSFVPAQQRNGQIKNVLNKEDIKVIAKLLDRDEKELGVYSQDSIIVNRSVALGKDTKFFNLEEVWDYIDFMILLSNEDKIAPSIADKNKKGTYKYYVEDEDDIAKIKTESKNINMLVFKEYGKMEDDVVKLTNFLKVHGQIYNKPFVNYSKKTKIEKLQTEVLSLIEDKIEQFANVVQEKDFDTILTIAEGIGTGVIKKDGTKYLLSEGDLLGNTLRETITYLKAKANLELLNTLQHKIQLKSE